MVAVWGSIHFTPNGATLLIYSYIPRTSEAPREPALHGAAALHVHHDTAAVNLLAVTLDKRLFNACKRWFVFLTRGPECAGVVYIYPCAHLLVCLLTY